MPASELLEIAGQANVRPDEKAVEFIKLDELWKRHPAESARILVVIR
jgi:hypothetical protein